VATHKPNVWIDLSGWSPKYFPKQLVQYANTLLKDRMLFGSDYPLITPDRWMKDFEVAGFKPEVMPGILKDNAVRWPRRIRFQSRPCGASDPGLAQPHAAGA
jgi:predicted TIM-barrel fold metal-dependent hydrolase